MAARPLISVVFSFRNEAGNIAELISRIEKAFSTEAEDYEAIFVNDDSTDESLNILIHERERNPRIRIISMARPFGVYECMWAGMEAASGDALVYMDSDLQDPPEIVPKLLSHWRAGADVVHTVRSKRRGENPLKMWIVRQAYKLIRFSSTIDLPVETGDFKLLSRRSVDHLLALRENDPYFRGLAVWIGGTQTFVPYDREPRRVGGTQRGLFSRNPCKVFVSGITSFSFLPIYVLVFAALAGLGLAVLQAIAAALLKPPRGAAGNDAWLFAIMTFFWASTIGAIGIVGVYIVRIYKDVRGRPRYIVRQRIGL